MTSRSTVAPVLLVLLAAGCGSEEAEEFMSFGSIDADPLVLTDIVPERSFRALVCLESPDDAEIDLRIGAVVEAPSPVLLTVSMQTPLGERSQTFPIEERTRADLEGLPPLEDAHDSCVTGLPITFGVVGPMEGPVEGPVQIEWALHFGFQADSELVDARVELVDDR